MTVKKYEMMVNENRLPYLIAIEDTTITDDQTFSNPNIIAKIIREIYHADQLPEEHVYLLAFDMKLHLLGLFELSHGTNQMSVVNSAQVLSRILLCGASAFCIVHNHPSGDVHPSEADNSITAQLALAADLCSVDFCDHIIIAGAHKNRYYSYAEESPVLSNPQCYV